MKKRKRFFAVLLSMGLMMACVLSASAATATVPHTHVFDITNEPVKHRIEVQPGNHTTIYYKGAYCSCGMWYEDIKETVTESHTMEYSDAGHTTEKVHDYWATCNYCGYRTLISMYCNGGNNHAKPNP